jgi:long-chain fatty acid transport protein
MMSTKQQLTMSTKIQSNVCKKRNELLLFFALLSAFMLSAQLAKAGGLMTNTNYHIAFDRMMARGATFDIDAAYSNPAGLAWGHDGWQLSFNWQMPSQDRDITTTFPLFTSANHTTKFHGEASAPFVPGLFAAYHHGKWAVSTMIGIVGSGGYVKYNDGLPMFNAPLMTTFYANYKLTPDKYTIASNVKGKQYIYGAQVCATYQISDHWAASAGFRANYYDGYYRGFVKATMNSVDKTLVDYQIDCDQTGWGFNPILGLDYHNHNLTLAAKYEFRAKLNIPNKTNTNTVPSPLGDAFNDGVKTRYDMPSLLTFAAGYEFTPKLRATLEYHFFDDKHAKMANNRQKELTHGTDEILAGAEYDINKTFTVSAGGQRTDYGLSDAYETNTSFACDSYSVGAGGAVNLNSHLRLNVSYFVTLYSDYTKHTAAATPGGYCSTTLEGTDVYSRTNGVFGIGVDYKF